MGNVIVMEPGQCYSVHSFSEDRLKLEQIQKLVDGSICIALKIPFEFSNRLWPDERVMSSTIIFCDDDGYAKNLPLCWIRPTDNHVLVGSLVWAQYDPVWGVDGPDEIWSTLAPRQEAVIVSWLKAEGWSEIVLDEIDYASDDIIMSGGEVAES